MSRDGAVAELAGLLLATGTFEELIQGVAALSTRTVRSAATCGITLSENGRVFTVASADALAGELDEQQYERGEGPCLEALSTATTVYAVDMAAETRWGDYPAIALGHGILSVLSTPLMLDDRAVGVLNLYGTTPKAFDDTDIQAASLLAGQAVIAVTAALRHYDEATLTEQLRAALSSRAVIDQAIGIVMAQRRCGADEAFATLRMISQRRNRKLRLVAADLVDAINRSVAVAEPEAQRRRS